MNERIKELEKQAQKVIWPADGNVTELTNLDIEKFAELIVKECAGIYSKIDNGNLHMGTDDYLEALRKHFGVDK